MHIAAAPHSNKVFSYIIQEERVGVPSYSFMELETLLVIFIRIRNQIIDISEKAKMALGISSR